MKWFKLSENEPEESDSVLIKYIWNNRKWL